MAENSKRQFIRLLIETYYTKNWADNVFRPKTIYDLFVSVCILNHIDEEYNRKDLKPWQRRQRFEMWDYLWKRYETPELFWEEFGGMFPPEFLAEFE